MRARSSQVRERVLICRPSVDSTSPGSADHVVADDAFPAQFQAVFWAYSDAVHCESASHGGRINSCSRAAVTCEIQAPGVPRTSARAASRRSKSHDAGRYNAVADVDKFAGFELVRGKTQRCASPSVNGTAGKLGVCRNVHSDIVRPDSRPCRRSYPQVLEHTAGHRQIDGGRW